ncbi:hypothetical protein BUALT_Bualt15G0034400 [Buddleja alternifolia]|uniref:Uncharacterized protein n=1 Tax=Buddleja alternifolia TaxID=168488 RepID=A0AAV6WHK7_9LAMI|nr:hypothetical protein BUALT_Bualt15G0034400 [Buddleja alternifolia]
METGVMMPSPPKDFNFDSACTTPYISAPSSPQRFGNNNFFYSAPTSPTRASAFYHGGASAIPFNWESKPGTPKSKQSHDVSTTATSSNYGDAEEDLDDTDFAFDFSGHLDRSNYPPADELFDGGIIKPLKPPPRFKYDHNTDNSPKSPRSPKEILREAFSPKTRAKKDFDPFAIALEQTRKENIHENDQRGRERTNNPSNSSNSRLKSFRSLSPFRVSDLLFDPEPVKNSSSIWYKKWKIKDLLLFRSASESRATDKDHNLKKYTLLKKTRQDDMKNSSFRSTDSVGSVSRRKSGPPISAHELHYTVNRAVSEEMKKRTSLPYKQGLLGCLGFHPTGAEISKGLSSTGSSTRA